VTAPQGGGPPGPGPGPGEAGPATGPVETGVRAGTDAEAGGATGAASAGGATGAGSAADGAAPDPEDRHRPLLARLAAANTLWIFLALVAMVVFFALLAPGRFLTPFNIRSIAADSVAILLLLAVGMTFVIITAGIDLSVGSVLIFSGVVAGKTMVGLGGTELGWGGIALGALAGLAAGLAWGLLNGVLIAKAQLPPLIVTLASYGAALGAAQILTGGVDVRDIPTKLTVQLGIGEFAGVPWIVWISAVVTVVFGLVLAYTRFGRYTYAIGSNAEAARRVGIRADRHLVKVYALSGLLAGLAGVLNLARFATTTIGGHSSDNLSAIAAVVLGGTSLFGGVGTIFGTVIGIFVPAVLSNGFVILGVQSYWQSVAVGAVLVAAVYLDQWRRRSRDRR
jgi:ribose transport system permease protein